MSVQLDINQKATLKLIVNAASRLKADFDALILNIDNALSNKADKSVVDEHTIQLSELQIAKFGFGDKFETVQVNFSGFGDKFA